MNKRKRLVMPVRTVPLTDEGMPDFYKRLKTGLLEEYKNKVFSHHMLTREVHFAIDEKIKNLKKNSQGDEKQKQQAQHLFTAHPTISRSALIESVAMLDHSIEAALFFYQERRLKKATEGMKDSQRIEDALNECLSGLEVSNEFKSYRSLMQNFRALRHQFAHNPVGIFSFTADKDNFESFVTDLAGIRLDESYHALSNGKAAVFITYNIESDTFLHKFFNESVKFYSMLLEILFPTDTSNRLS